MRGLFPASPTPSFILRGYVDGELIERRDLSTLEVLCSGGDGWRRGRGNSSPDTLSGSASRGYACALSAPVH